MTWGGGFVYLLSEVFDFGPLLLQGLLQCLNQLFHLLVLLLLPPQNRLDLKIELDQIGLSLGQGRLQDIGMLPQCTVGLPQPRQLPFLVLQLQRQLLVGVLQLPDPPLEASCLLKLSTTGQIPEFKHQTQYLASLSVHTRAPSLSPRPRAP